MKDKRYWHTLVDIKEYPFPKVYLTNYSETEIKELIKIKSKFNKSKDINEKYKLAEQLPEQLFCKCRFCGKLIVNINFNIRYEKHKNYFHVRIPEIWCREIDDEKYYLSCCEDCLLKHFKDDLPRFPKYYFMKANKYGAYSFGYDEDTYKKICSMTVGVTEKSMINKYGEIEGKKRWIEYCNKQAETNTFEYKEKKYGWSKEQFDEFNKSRAITLNNMINKYGEKIGIEVYNNYTYLQSYKKSYEYMVETFGKEKANEINRSKALTLDNFIRKYGEEIGKIKYQEVLNTHFNFFSKISQNFFDEIDKFIGKKYTTYYASKNTEYGVNLVNNYVMLDYFILELNLCIEFNGTVFHGDPKIFNENDYPNPYIKTITAKELWNKDNERYKKLKELKNIDTVVVWESDYRNGIDIEKFIKETLKIEI